MREATVEAEAEGPQYERAHSAHDIRILYIDTDTCTLITRKEQRATVHIAYIPVQYIE